MIDARAGFSHSYANARKRFFGAAQASGLQVESHKQRMPGHDQETLSMDVVLDGPPDADRLLVVSSGVHGVEGFCGSGIQVFALQDEALRAKARERGVALLYIHAVNPYGFSYIRRATHENVDLNRNFFDYSKPLPANVGYRALHPLLLPEQWPPTLGNKLKLAWLLLRHGKRAVQTAVSAGQYEFSKGLFFGGTEPTWSNETLRAVVRKYAAHARHIAWIDLHTGLGPSGKGERILSARNDSVGLADAQAMWGDGVTSFFQQSTVSANVSGSMLDAIQQECAQADFNAITIEYGTAPLKEVLAALRAEQWLQNHPRTSLRKAAAIRRQMLEAFFTDTDAWKEQVVSQAREAMLQSVAGLDAH
ncbi:MAG: M14 family metallopeptidase [Betaproteobacteria bacterium]